MNTPIYEIKAFKRKERAKALNIPELIRLFDKTYGEEWRSKKRHPEYVEMRSFYYRISTKLGHTQYAMAAAIGQSRCTIVNSQKKLTERIQFNDQLTTILLQKLPVEFRKLVK